MKLLVTVYEDEATSFGSVADSYDRARPGPPAEALDWLVPAGCEVAVDLGAGTGLFTRALLGRAARVVAVEPDARMRKVLARRSRAGTATRTGWADQAAALARWRGALGERTGERRSWKCRGGPGAGGRGAG